MDQPAGSPGRRPARVCATQRQRGGNDLFWHYAFVTCQEQAAKPQAVFEHHRLDRGVVDQCAVDFWTACDEAWLGLRDFE